MDENKSEESADLLSYINSQKESGVSIEEIKQTLLSQGGWSEEDIDKVLAGKTTEPEAPKEQFIPGSAQGNTASDTENKNGGLIIAVVVILGLIIIGGGFYVWSQTRELAAVEPALVVEEEEVPAIDENALNLELLDAIAIDDTEEVQKALDKGANTEYETKRDWFYVEGERRAVGKEIFEPKSQWPMSAELSELSLDELRERSKELVSKISTSTLVLMGQGEELPSGELSESDYIEYKSIFVGPNQEDEAADWKYIETNTTPIEFAEMFENAEIINLLTETSS